MYTFEHSTPEVIEAAIEQLGSSQALIAVTMIQTLLYSLFGWVVGYFIVDRLGLMKPFRFEKKGASDSCNTDVFWENYRIDSVSLFSAEWFICSVLWQMVPQVWYSVCNVGTFRNSFHI